MFLPNARPTKANSTSSVITRMGFWARSAKRGKWRPASMPSTRGNASTSATSSRMFQGSSAISVTIARVLGLSQP